MPLSVNTPVPAEISAIQLRRALRSHGLHASVAAYVASQPDEVVEEWEYATEFPRQHPLIVSAAAALGLTEQQADDLFRLGATL